MIEQDLGSVEYVSNQFGKFYSTGAQCVDAPPEIKHREFGFLSFRGRTMFRHIGFEVIEELRKGNPSIWVREHQDDNGLAVRMLTLKQDSEEIIARRLREIFS